MKQIIDGKIYDTNKATLIYADNDFWKPRIYYQTNKGTYFCWYKRNGKLDIVNEDIIKEVLAEHDVDKYIELFGAVEEG